MSGVREEGLDVDITAQGPDPPPCRGVSLWKLPDREPQLPDLWNGAVHTLVTDVCV